MPPTEGPKLKIKLVRSPIAHNPRNRATVEALGLRRMGQVVEKEDNASIRGMIHKISNMLVVEVSEGADPIVDATNPGSSARMLDKRVHRRMGDEPKPKKRPGKAKKAEKK